MANCIYIEHHYWNITPCEIIYSSCVNHLQIAESFGFALCGSVNICYDYGKMLRKTLFCCSNNIQRNECIYCLLKYTHLL